MHIRQTLFLSLGIIALCAMIGLFAPTAVSAIEFRDGKCQGFATDNSKKLTIFLIAPVQGHTTDPQGEPMTGSKFCVEVPFSASTISWQDLQSSSGGLVSTSLASSRLVLHLKKDSWVKPSWESPYARDFEYPLDKQFDGFRARYHVILFPGNYLYFIKIAEQGDQLSNPVTSCISKPNEGACGADTQCFWTTSGCKARADTSINCTQLTKDTCFATHCTVVEDKCVQRATTPQVNTAEAVRQYIDERYGAPPGYDGPLPDCAFSGQCRSVDNLVELAIKVVEYFFGIIAGLALAFFVYGGVLMIASFGNTERFTKGRQVLIAATIGLAIAFSAYVIVGFVVDALGIQASLLQLP